MIGVLSQDSKPSDDADTGSGDDAGEEEEEELEERPKRLVRKRKLVMAEPEEEATLDVGSVGSGGVTELTRTLSGRTKRARKIFDPADHDVPSRIIKKCKLSTYSPESPVLEKSEDEIILSRVNSASKEGILADSAPCTLKRTSLKKNLSKGELRSISPLPQTNKDGKKFSDEGRRLKTDKNFIDKHKRTDQENNYNATVTMESRRRSSGKFSLRNTYSPEPSPKGRPGSNAHCDGMTTKKSDDSTQQFNSSKIKQKSTHQQIDSHNRKKDLKSVRKDLTLPEAKPYLASLKDEIVQHSGETFKVPAPKKNVGKLTPPDKKTKFKAKSDPSSKPTSSKISKLSVRSTRAAANISSVGSSRSVSERPGICMDCNLSHKKNENLVFCKNCSKTIHPGCLHYPEDLTDRIYKQSWQCIDCKTCFICDKGEFLL